MRELNIPIERLHVIARRRASRDHRDSMNWIDCRVVSVEFFDRIYSGTPDDIGTIDVQYHLLGYRALYGFTADGKLTMYAN